MTIETENWESHIIKREEEQFSEKLARQLDIPILLEIPSHLENAQLLEPFSYSFIKTKLFLPLERKDNAVIVAIVNLFDLNLIQFLHSIFEQTIKCVYTSKSSLKQAIAWYYREAEREALKSITEIDTHNDTNESTSISHSKDLFDLSTQEDAPVIRLVNVLLAEAYAQKVSDIHIEPHENHVSIRYRVDGILQARHHTLKQYQQQLIARIKLIARLDITETRLPQDGHAKVSIGEDEIDLRVSTLPVTQGERVVIRILDKLNMQLGIEKLGMPTDVYNLFKKLIYRPTGLILVTGPTGSGKTTTLYSALIERAKEFINIMTIEDPVEYQIPGIAQMNIHQKIDLTFAAGLKHILRQDPDIIMIGEIRDRETAQIAVQASLTGHLVFSTLHTNDSVSAITRLLDMGIEPYLLASSLIGVVAQRLVRTMCSVCRGEGCSTCFQSKYQGRIGIYELLLITDVIQQGKLNRKDTTELNRLAASQGISSLWDQGSILVSSGLTTPEELIRIIN